MSGHRQGPPQGNPVEGSSGVPILMYHEVTPTPASNFRFYSVTPEVFGRQMRFLARAGYSTLSLDDLAHRCASRAPLPSRSVIITFDDGFRSCIEHAVPHLERFGFSATFFVVAGLVGGGSQWLREILGHELPLADWGLLRWLSGRGFTCGAHSLSHPHLTQLSPDARQHELAESKRMLEAQLERPVAHLAYPYGEYDPEIRAMVQELGYRTACAVRGGLSGLDSDVYALRRIAVGGEDSMLDFAFRVRTARFPGEYLRAKGRGALAWARGLGGLRS